MLMTDAQGVIGLSEGQIQDMLRLQRLCVTKRGLLAMERKAIIDQTARLECFDRESPNIVTQLSDLTTKLRANAAKDYKVYLRVACASRRGVSSAACLVRLLVCRANTSVVLFAAGMSFIRWALHALYSLLCGCSGSLWCIVLTLLTISLQLVCATYVALHLLKLRIRCQILHVDTCNCAFGIDEISD